MLSLPISATSSVMPPDDTYCSEIAVVTGR